LASWCKERPSASLVRRVEAVLERPTDGGHVALARGGEDALSLAVVDRGLEPAPAGEVVLARDEQLGTAEARAGVPRAQRFQTLLGFVLQVLEAGAVGQLV
jgi:hypothetical protein